MLPLELQNREGRLKDYADDFQLAQRMVRTGIETLEAFARIPPKQMTDVTKAVVGGLIGRAVRQYRGIVALAELGLVEDMEILCRSLFENLLALRFIVRLAKRLASCSPELQAVRTRLPPIPRKHRAIDFRAVLYASAFHMALDEKVAKAQRVQGMKRILSKAKGNANARIAAQARSFIGPDWVRAQKSGRSYSGLSIKLLAEHCGLSWLYESAYGIMSIRTHANDGFTHVDREGSVWVVSVVGSEAKLQATMHLAASIFGILLRDVDKCFCLQLHTAHSKLLERFGIQLSI